jgi:hypothetical protein
LPRFAGDTPAADARLGRQQLGVFADRRDLAADHGEPRGVVEAGEIAAHGEA